MTDRFEDSGPTPAWSTRCTATTSRTRRRSTPTGASSSPTTAARSAPTAARRPRAPAPPRRPRRRPAAARRRRAASDGAPTGPARCSTARAASRSAAPRPASSRTWRRASASRPPPRCATVPAKLLEVNRQILNNHLARTGARQGRASPTSSRTRCVRALADVPGDELGVRRRGRQARRRAPRAREPRARGRRRRSATARARCSCRTSRTPTRSTSPAFCAAYEELIAQGPRRTRSRPTTSPAPPCTITNPGMIGTVHSVPRLMPGQGFIVGVGSDRLPGRVRGRRPARRSPQLGVEQGHHAHQHLRPPHHQRRGERRVPAPRSTTCCSATTASTTTIFASLARAVRAGALERRPQRRSTTRRPQHEKVVQVHAAHQHVPRARPPHREPRPARSPRARHPPRARHQPLRPHDLGPRPRVPGRQPRRRARSAARRCRCATSSACCATRTRAPSASSTCTSRSPTRRSGSRSGSRRRTRSSPRRSKRRILERLNAAEAFERFLHTKYLGPEALQPRRRGDAHPDARRAAARTAADAGMAEVVLGHGAPRPAQRARQRGRQVVRADLPRVRGRARPVRARRAPAT